MSKLTKIKSGGVILTLFLLGLFSGNAWGQEVVVFEEDFSELTDGGNTSNTGEGAPSGTAWNGNDNFPNVTSAYPAGETVKLGASSKGGTLTSKELDLSGNGGAFQVSFDVKGWTKNEGPIKVSLDGGATQTVEYSALIGDAFENVVLSFTGGTSASTLTFASQKRAFLDNIKISCQQSEVTQVATPVLTPRSTNFTDQLTVTATCATDGATIYYTTDGSEPTTGSAMFPAEGLTLTETTTVKAMAANGELENSNVAEETYTKVTAMSIAEFKALENNAEGMLDLTGAVVTAVGSNDIFVQDAEGNGIDLYRSNQDWNVGDVLSGVASGSFVLYKNMPEFSNGDFSGVTVTPGTGVAPKVVTIAELLANPAAYYCTLVKVEGVACNGSTFAQGDDAVDFYDKFYAFEDSYAFPATADVTGVFIPYDDKRQICPRSEADVEDATGLEYPDFYWRMASVSVDINNVEAAVYPTLTNTSDGEVTYTSSNEDVATISAEGIVTIVGVGTTMITASVAATATFNGATTAYELRVIDPSALPEATAIVAENGGVYYAMTNTEGDTRLIAVPVNVVNGKVLATGDAIDWYVDYAAGTIQDANGMYVAHTGGSDIELSEESFAWNWNGSIWVSPNEADRALSYNPQITAFRAYDPENKSQKVAGPMPIVNGYTRTVSAGNYGTICLPYAVAAEDFAGVEFYSVAGKLMNGGQPSAIVLAPVTELEAGVPYIFSATDDQLLAAYSGDRAEAASANGLVGTFEYIDVAEGMYMISSANKVQLCGTGCTLGANRAYINMAEVAEVAEAGANMRVISLDGTVTGIDGVEAGGNQLVDVYTISGVRVRAQVPAAEATDGLQGGLYIVNGKKVAVK